MRYLILSDVHANLEALEAVLASAASRGYDRVLVLGDLVGYGADPNAVVDRVRALAPAAAIRGNHDKVACGIEDADGFNLVARQAIEWTHQTLTPENRSWLAALPAGPVLVEDRIEICHGTTFDEDAYVFDELDALRSIEGARAPVCFYGHTHIPITFRQGDEGLEIFVADRAIDTMTVAILPASRYLVNPGSVGQPRDGNPRAGFAILDTTAEAIDSVRVDYAVSAAQQKIVRAGLPDMLAKRLAAGR